MKLLERLIPRGLWLDATAYGRRMFLDGRPLPWREPAQVVSFLRQIDQLLAPTVVSFDAEAFVAAWADDRRELLRGTGARPTAELRKLLAEVEIRTSLDEAIHAACESFPQKPLAFVMPSPCGWLKLAHRYGNSKEMATPVDADTAEMAAMYLADFLRTFAARAIAGVLFTDDAESLAGGSDDSAAYQPIANVANHYRWDLGIRLSGDIAAQHPSNSDLGFGFCIATRDVSPIAGPYGVALGADFWSGEPAPPVDDSGFYFATVPTDVVPERALEYLARLREAKSGDTR